MTCKIISITDVLDGKFNELPKWMKEVIENHKSRWEPDSKGGEPNCRREEND